MKHYFLLLFATIGFALSMEAQQGIGIGTLTPNGESILELSSTTKGLLIPRMTGTQRTDILTPPQGLMVFQNDGALGFWYHDGTTWERFAKSSEVGGNSWSITGANQYSNVAGNVGIGITSGINEKLFLHGDMFINAPGGALGNQLNNAELKIRGTNTGSGVLSFLKPDSTSAASISYSWFTQTMNLRNSESDSYMRFYGNGNVGIGTNAPLDDALAKLQIKGGTFANYTTNHGYLLLGDENGLNLALGNYEILARDDGAAAPLFLQHEGGAVRIGQTALTADTRLHITDGGEAGLATHGYVVLGQTGGSNMVFDVNEIQARLNGAATTLRLQQDGGSLLVQGSALVVGSTGNVGIGDITPDEKLNVLGNALFEGHVNMDAADPTLQLLNAGVEKGFMQLAGDNIRIGTNSANDNGQFVIRTNGGDRVFVNGSGNMGIGTAAISQHRLAVSGSVICEELKVELVADWPDYVFAKDYALTPLSELKLFIEAHQHLPNIPKASEVQRDGFEVGEMNRKLLEKVEELTLYIIQQQEQIDEMKHNLHLLNNK